MLVSWKKALRAVCGKKGPRLPSGPLWPWPGKLRQHACHPSTLAAAQRGAVDLWAGLVGGEDPHDTACHLAAKCFQLT